MPHRPRVDRNVFWQELNSRLGAELRPNGVTEADYASKLATVLECGDLPDCVQLPLTTPRLPDVLQAHLRSITAWQGQNQDNINDPICMSGGVTTYVTCDIVSSKDNSKTYLGGFKVDWLRTSWYSHAGGDSGAPVFQQNAFRAVGMHIGYDDNFIFAVYMHIYDVLLWSGMNGGLYIS